MMRIHTERLLLRRIRRRDLDGLMRLDLDFSNTYYASYDLPWPQEKRAMRRLLHRFIQTRLFFAVLLDRRMIGYVCFCEEEDSYDVSYLIHSAHWGQGYAKESVAAAMDFVKKTESVTTFTAVTARENLPSCKLLLRLGFQEAGRQTVSFFKDEKGEDIFFEAVSFEKSV